MRIPGFRIGFVSIGVLFMLLASSILVRGVPVSMAPFGLPEATLASPHYKDAIIWVYVHMVVLGGLFVVVGALATELRLQRTFARFVAGAQLVYLYLDVRTSDTPLGNGLYQGPESAIPAVIGFVCLCVFLVLSFVPARRTDAATRRTAEAS